MPTKTTELSISITPCDPWADAPDPRKLTHRARREMKPADAAPGAWWDLREPVRCRLGALCARVLEDHPVTDVGRLHALAVGALRATWQECNTALDAAGQEYANRFFVEDEAERRQWRAVEVAITGSTLITETLTKLRARSAAATAPAA